MKQSKTVVRACDLIISRIRFETAVLSLSDSLKDRDEDTEKIRTATKLYVETWIVPLLELIRNGEISKLQTHL